jgi:hypothetical protein
MIALPKRRTISPLGHSADISLWLHVGDQKISLAQTGPTGVVLEARASVPNGPARVEIVNDGFSYFSDVTITGCQCDRVALEMIR